MASKQSRKLISDNVEIEVYIIKILILDII